MSEKQNGGNAFPAAVPWSEQHVGAEPGYYDGMSLRDWFAGQALAGIAAAAGQSIHFATDQHTLATRAYELANIMLERRK